ncbi:MAG: hypothetical protein J7604_17285 [Sporocytophaga sp.]|uniref:hypothetical protein n=1 Tax=Sporocytophaga sp. TaxID=2231183 RepID=UPI001B22DB29|nr:hypothetical protein [Sporocytophaga sp.]MBO9701964.1 hypothetical protein [Sporocytophaga sp.]
MIEYLPKTDDQLLSWLKNFSDQLKSIGGSLGITPAEVSSMSALILDIKTDIRGDRSGSELEIKKEKMFKFLNDLVIKMKANPAYNETDHGKKLNIK